MASGRVFRRKVNGELQKTWTAQYDAPADNRGKRKQKMKGGFKTKKEAEAFLATKQHEINTGGYVEVSKMTLGQLLWFYYENHVVIKTELSSQLIYRGQIRIIADSSIGNMEISKMQPLHFEGFYNELRNKGLKGSTINRYHAVIRSAFRFAVRKRLIQFDPTQFVDRPSQEESTTTYLEPEHVKVVFGKLKENKHYEIMLFALFTGMRIGEVLGLRFKDVDFERCELTVNQIAQRLTGYGLVIKDSPKTKSSRRTISLSQTEVDILKRAKIKVAKNKLLLGELYEDKDLVFAKTNGYLHDPQYISRIFKVTRRKLNLGDQYTLHSLRHTMATYYLEQTKDFKVVQERLGHKKASTTMDTYLHVMKNKDKEAAQKGGEFISKIAFGE